MNLSNHSTRELMKHLDALKDALEDVSKRAEWTEIQHEMARVSAEIQRRKHGEE